MAPPMLYPGRRIPVPQTRRFHAFGLAPGAPYPTRATYEHIHPLRAFGVMAGLQAFGATASQQSATYVAAMQAAADLKAKQLASQNNPIHSAPVANKTTAAVSVLNASAAALAGNSPAPNVSAPSVSATNVVAAYNAQFAQAQVVAAQDAAAVAAAKQPTVAAVINQTPATPVAVNAAGMTPAAVAQTLANRAAYKQSMTPAGFNPHVFYPADATPAQIAAADARINAVLPSYAGLTMTPAQTLYQFQQANKAQTPNNIAETKSILSTPIHGEAAAVAAGRVQDSAAALKVVQDYNQSVYPTGGVQAKIADVNAALASGAAKTVTEAVLQSVPAAQAAQTVQYAQPQYNPPVYGSTPVYMGAPTMAPAGGVSVTVAPQAATDSAGNVIAPAGGNSVVIAAVIGALALWFTSK
jgi:hypothetical protein